MKWYWLGKKELRLVLTQTQPGNAFVDPIHITISTAKGKRDLVLNPTGKLFIQRIPLRDKPVKIDFDPRNTLLDESTVKAG